MALLEKPARDDPRATETTLMRVLTAVGRVLQLVPRALALVLVLAWASVIWFVSSVQPPTVVPPNAFGSVLSNLAHAPEFGVLTLSVCLLLPRREGWVATEARLLRAVWLLVVSYACIDELHQGFTPHRDPSAFDVLTDAAAAACVLIVVRLTAGPHADARKLPRALVLGVLACIVCAALATSVPGLEPEWEWL